MIYTLGHGTRTIKQFINILLDNGIKYVVDVRSYPKSRTNPQFNEIRLRNALAKYKIKYKHIQELGGFRHLKISYPTTLTHKSFSSYAEYMLSDEFKKGLDELKAIAEKYKTAYICSETLYWKCHRRMISDALEYQKWQVYHLGITNEPIRHTVWNLSRKNRKGQIIYDK